MKVLLIHQDGPSNPLTWSGIPNAIGNALTTDGVDVVYLGPLKRKFTTGYAIRKRLWEKFRLGYLDDVWNITNLKNFSRQVDSEVELKKPDLIFSLGVVPIAFVATKVPIIAWTDITFKLLAEEYLKNPCPETILSGNWVERNAMKRAQAIIYSSCWAAQSAIRDYGFSPEKAHAWAVGSNFSPKNGSEEVHGLIKSRSERLDCSCELLFVSVDYQRKGGAVALQILEALVSSGVRATLHVIGRGLPEHLAASPMIRNHGFLNKAKVDDARKMAEIFASAHFLILPSRADCTPIVIAEAAAWGIPIIASNVGGIPEMIDDRINGFIVAPSDDEMLSEVAQYVEIIGVMILNRSRYVAVAHAALETSHNKLSWEIFASRFIGLASKITGHCAACQ
jgi:glycosyltransferase involved in cell wall biosynthesis